jgi:dTDP-4-amino-4,6-dideoxygalactose transaminase
VTFPRIWLSAPHMSGTEQSYVAEAFATNWIAPLGPHVDAFEVELGRYVGVEDVACLSSGTAAIHLALKLLNVGQGDEVLVSSFTFSATANPVIYQGATPIFIDSEPSTWNMDPQLLEVAILDRLAKGKRPKAIIPVHLYGMPARMPEIMQIAMKYDIPVIEDGAESLGSTIDGKHMGTFGIMGVLSFNGNKIITTSGGGALLCSNRQLASRARFFATQSRDPAPHYQHSELGFNYRMSNILAGVGRGQLEALPSRIAARRANFDYYRDRFKNISGFSFLQEPAGYFSNRWLSTVLVNEDATNGVTRETIRLALDRRNIESRPLWKPLHLQPFFESAPRYTNGCSEYLFEKGLCLPSSSSLSGDEKAFIAETIEAVLDGSML